MAWSLQQINNANPAGPSVANEFVAVPEATAAPVPGTLFVCTFGNQQHFTYVSLTQEANLQDCWWDGDANQWNLQQINNANAAGPSVANEFVAVPAGTLPATAGTFVCTFGNQQHFTYLDLNGNLQDCWYDGDANQWNLQQINNANPIYGGGVANEFVAVPEATAPATPGSLFVCTFGNQQHFTYLDGNFNLQDCWYDEDANQWNLQQINNANGAGPSVANEFVAVPTATFPVAGSTFVCTFGNQQHFTYLDGNGNLQDCWYDGDANQWNLQQINNANPIYVPGVANEFVAVPAATAPATPGSLFVCTFGNQQHFTYLDGNGNLQDCWYDGDANQWNLQQINNANAAGPSVANEFVAVPTATAPAALTSPTGPANTLFVCTFGNQQHFTYLDGNGNLQDCWWG
ncbi:hypothetical protein [Mycobacterium sp.]|uniref:hypothetical protein n=1 Tax=Mycobacterium sp. TaxID=1785 RepID=UPI002C4120CB|nr:hypothetical protein [Mycobacterium sp.]HME48932.1 hypothetical protein [Mycobacterium sp.]